MARALMLAHQLLDLAPLKGKLRQLIKAKISNPANPGLLRSVLTTYKLDPQALLLEVQVQF